MTTSVSLSFIVFLFLQPLRRHIVAVYMILYVSRLSPVIVLRCQYSQCLETPVSVWYTPSQFCIPLCGINLHAGHPLVSPCLDPSSARLAGRFDDPSIATSVDAKLPGEFSGIFSRSKDLSKVKMKNIHQNTNSSSLFTTTLKEFSVGHSAAKRNQRRLNDLNCTCWWCPSLQVLLALVQ